MRQYVSRRYARTTIYVMLARHEGLPEDDVLKSKHVGANHL